MLKELIISFQSYRQAHSFIRRHRLWKWIVLPGILYSVLFGIGAWAFVMSSNQFIDYLSGVLGVFTWLDRVHSSWLQFFVAFDRAILWLILLFFYFSLFRYLILVLGSPLFAYLAQRTETVLEEGAPPLGWASAWADIRRSVGMATRNVMWQAVYLFSLLLLSFIPLAGWVTPLAAFAIECYYYGFSMLDHSCAYHHLPPSRSTDFIGEHKGLAVGNGIVFYLLHLIPVAGWVFAPAYALVAAALSLNPYKQ